MKIMHTADWHLGLITEGLSRKDEQQKILNEICEIADSKEIDIVLICGDLLCGVNTPSYADEMFANTMLRLSCGGRRAVVVIAGNNDATERFTATKQFGLANNIFLLSDLGTDFDDGLLPKTAKIKLTDRGRGFLVFEKGSEKACIAFMPYPSNFFENEKSKQGEDVIEKTKRLFKLGASGFMPNCFNIAAAHMFVPYGKVEKDFYFEFSRACLPEGADYVALGHVHDLIEIDEKTVYSGSVIQAFEKENTSKFVVVLNVENNKLLNKEFVRLKEPKKIVVITGETVDELKTKLSKLDNCLAKVLIKQEKITSDEISVLKTEFPFVHSFVLIPKSKKASFSMASKKISDEELLTKFYETTYAKKPLAQIQKLFLQTLRGEENETH